MTEKKKKKWSPFRFFTGYILLLALLLLGVAACTGRAAPNDTKILSENSPSASPAAASEGTAAPGGTQDPAAPGETQAPAAPGDTQAPAAPGDTQAPAAPGGTQSPSSPTAPPANPPASGGSLAGLKVTIDPGHQAHAPSGKETLAPWSSETKAKNTSGTTGTTTGTDEYLINLQIALKLRDMLTSEGAEVVMTRDNNGTSLSNQDRAAISNNAGSKVIISIHCNGADNASVTGTEVYSRGEGDGSSEYASRSATETKLADKLVSAICKETGSKNRGAKTSDSYTGINYAKAPCFIVECGFLSSPDEDRLLNEDAYQKKIATGIRSFLIDNKDAF